MALIQDTKWLQDQVTNNKAPRLEKSSGPEDFFSQEVFLPDLSCAKWTPITHQQNPTEAGYLIPRSKTKGVTKAQSQTIWPYTEPSLPNFNVHVYPPDSRSAEPAVAGLGWAWGLDFCTSNCFPGNTDDANPRPTLLSSKLWRARKLSQNSFLLAALWGQLFFERKAFGLNITSKGRAVN